MKSSVSWLALSAFALANSIAACAFGAGVVADLSATDLWDPSNIASGLTDVTGTGAAVVTADGLGGGGLVLAGTAFDENLMQATSFNVTASWADTTNNVSAADGTVFIQGSDNYFDGTNFVPTSRTYSGSLAKLDLFDAVNGNFSLVFLLDASSSFPSRLARVEVTSMGLHDIQLLSQAVPLPASVSAGAAGLAGLGLVKAVARRRKH